MNANRFLSKIGKKKSGASVPSISTYQAVKLVLTATDLPNLETFGMSDPYFKVYGYSLTGEHQLLYTSEVVAGTVEFVKWKEAIFGISKSTIFSKFKVIVFDKEFMGTDRILAGPVDISIKDLEKRTSVSLGVGKAKIQVNKFEKIWKVYLG